MLGILVLVIGFGSAACSEPVVRAIGCQAGNVSESVEGPQPARDQPLPANTTLAALGASWGGTDPYPLSFLGTAPGACVVNGSVIGSWPDTDPWTDWHHRSALRFSQPDFTVFAMNIENTGDAIKPKDGDDGEAQDFVIFGNRVARAHDDCIEDDYLHAGTIADNLLDGCYVVFSARASNSGLDGTRNTLNINDNVAALEPMQSVYKGSSPGHGGFFKWSTEAPRVALTGNTLMVAQAPNHGDLAPPSGLVTCSGNVIVWLGPGEFPARDAWRSACPDTTITTDPAVYTNARAAWLATHRPGGLDASTTSPGARTRA
ncbi:MAG: hypothetical protein ACXV8Y_11205 [Acidimicrobiia bacterium]